MLGDLVKLLFPRTRLFLYKDEMSTTLHYAETRRRTNPMLSEFESSAKSPREGFAVDYSSDGYVQLNVEIGRPR